MIPLVSICLPNFNGIKYLPPRMESILSQTLTDWELIICDSHSDDGSWEYLQKFRKDSRIRFNRVSRAGCYAGWNECLRRATGAFVYIATADDTCEPTCLFKMVQALHAYPDVKLAVCDYVLIGSDGSPVGRDPGDKRRQFFGEWLERSSLRNGKTEFLLHACFLHAWVTMTSVMFRKSLLDQIGLFRLDRGIVADMEWSMRASLASDIVYVPEKLATWRQHDQQASRSANCIRMAENALECVDAVLASTGSGIPEDWRKKAAWFDEIRKIARVQYYDSYGLYRERARIDGFGFLNRACLAFLKVPSLFFRQMMNGFKWSESYSPDPILHAQHLVKLFQSSWPPDELSHG